MIQGGLQLNQTGEYNCIDDSSSDVASPAGDVQQLAETGEAVVEAVTGKKKSGVRHTLEIISPAFAKSGKIQRRTTISDFSIFNSFGTGNTTGLTDAQLNYLFRLNTSMSPGETPLEYARRGFLAVTLARASEPRKTSSEQALNYIAERMKGKSFQTKIQFLGFISGKMLENYDEYKTRDNGDSPDESLWRGLDVHNKTNSPSYKAGVCRHIHQLAVKMARKMGLKMSYGLSYVTADEYHLTGIITNPENPSETIRLNYQNIESSHGKDGSGAVAQNLGAAPNASIYFHVWDHNDRPVFYFPTKRGVILERQTGGDLSLIDPNISYSAPGVTHTTHLNGHQLRVFNVLNDEVQGGETIMGVSHYMEVPMGDHFSFSLGSALYTYSNNPVTADTRNAHQSGVVLREKTLLMGFI